MIRLLKLFLLLHVEKDIGWLFINQKILISKDCFLKRFFRVFIM